MSKELTKEEKIAKLSEYIERLTAVREQMQLLKDEAEQITKEVSEL